MITEQQQEQASLYALDALSEAEARAFEAEMRGNAALRELVRDLQSTADLLAMSMPPATLPTALRDKVLARIEEAGSATAGAPSPGTEGAQRTARPTAAEAIPGLRFIDSADSKGWKPLPVPGAYIKLLSLEQERGYAVLLGKLDPGTRYPAHVNAGPEDFFVLTGDLVIGDRKLVAGDFHHADKGSQHTENYSVEGCTLLAVLTTDDPLVAFAMT